MTIVTHNGKFHADDVFAVATLLLFLRDKKVEIVRTRNEDKIKGADFVVDVGDVYDVQKNLFDHHQSGGAGARTNGIPYASFGLVWKEYGKDICNSVEIAEQIDKILVQPVDARDNGIDVTSSNFIGIREYTISDILRLYRPSLSELPDFDKRFREAVAFGKSVIEMLTLKLTDFKQAEKVVREKYYEAQDKQILIFNREEAFGRELIVSTLLTYPEPFFAVLFRPESGRWQSVAINEHENTYSVRLPFPVEWRGLKGKELEKVSKVKGAITCHRAGFMCMADSQDGALELARKALELNNQ